MYGTWVSLCSLPQAAHRLGPGQRHQGITHILMLGRHWPPGWGSWGGCKGLSEYQGCLCNKGFFHCCFGEICRKWVAKCFPIYLSAAKYIRTLLWANWEKIFIKKKKSSNSFISCGFFLHTYFVTYLPAASLTTWWYQREPTQQQLRHIKEGPSVVGKRQIPMNVRVNGEKQLSSCTS